MIECIIIDDEPHAVKLLEDYVSKADDLLLIKSFTNAIEAFHFLNQHTIDLVFLDIQMPEITGIQLLKLLHAHCNVVFTTAYEHYALKGYEMDVIDYLLKPISIERFLQCIEKCKKRLKSTKIPNTKTKDNPQNLFIKSGHRTVRVAIESIQFLEAQSDYVAIVTDGEKIMTLENLRYFEQILPKDLFVRTHRSFIVGIKKIDYIERKRIIINKAYIPISKSYEAAFWKMVEKP